MRKGKVFQKGRRQKRKGREVKAKGRAKEIDKKAEVEFFILTDRTEQSVNSWPPFSFHTPPTGQQ
jgi:hypothetical protein